MFSKWRRLQSLAAILFVTLAVVGCGSDSGDGGNGGGGPVLPGPNYNGPAIITPGGGLQISFTGSNVWNSNILMAAGPVSYSQYCGYFTNGQTCWAFYTQRHDTQLYTSSGGMPALSSGTLTYTGSSRWEAGAAVSVVSTYPVNNRANVAGTIVLPPSFISRNPGAFPQGVNTPIVGVSIDFGISGSGNQYQYGGTYGVTGGVLIYTSANGGAFLAI